MKTLILGLSSLLPLAAQITPEQRVADFQTIQSVLNRNYVAYEWKRDLFGFDLLRSAPWIDRIRAARDEFEYYSVLAEYVSSLRDTSSFLIFETDFSAELGFGVDLYDNKPLIDFIDRSYLPARTYPFTIGDELISIDGRSVESLLADMARFGVESNDRGMRRFTADLLTFRFQGYDPNVGQLGESAVVVIQRAGGAAETYTIRWRKSGTPMKLGPVPNFRSAPPAARLTDFASEDLPLAGNLPIAMRQIQEMAPERFIRRKGIRAVQAEASDSGQEIVGYAALAPVYALPAGFQQRLGRSRTDSYFSGTFTAEGKRFGYLRISNFGAQTPNYYSQLEAELAFFEANTDALIIDQMRDAGGSFCVAERVGARILGRPFRQPGFEVRPTRDLIQAYSDTVDLLRLLGAEQWVVLTYQAVLDQLRGAYNENRGRTGPVPLCGSTLDRFPVTDRTGQTIRYSKPLLLVVDEFSTDFLPALLKDNGKATLFGYRTRGYAGNGIVAPSLGFGELTLYTKNTMMSRSQTATNPGYPATNYVENTGVHPDVVADYMTAENLRAQGRPFVQAMVQAALRLLQ
jgi:hypothetical protein